MRKLHLASASPRRRDILDSLGLAFSAGGVDCDEAPLAGEAAADMVLRLAAAKAAAAHVGADTLVIGADTAVVVGHDVFGKPQDQDDALQMLARLSGRKHVVVTGVAVTSPAGTRTALSSTDVQFREIGPDEARAYWHSGEPRDKAGGYAIQGLGGVFVESIAGSYSGVVGLPVYETASLLRAAGIDVFGRTDRATT